MSIPIIKILIVDDDPLDSAIINDLLHKNDKLAIVFESRHVATLNEAMEFLRNNEVDAVILDLNLPDSKGLDTLKRLHGACPDLPVVVNTGLQDHDLGLEAVIHGAQDFLIKGEYNPFILAKSLFYAIERKRQEEMLREANENLRCMQQELMDTEKIRLVGLLASGIAHEIKNPLAVIVHGAEYLKQKLNEADTEIQHTLEAIINAAQRANVSIKDLLDIAHPSKLHIERVKPREILEKTLQMVHHALTQQNIMIEWDWNDPGIQISADRGKLEQIFMNIVLNALSLMPSGGKLLFRCRAVQVNDEVYAKFDPRRRRLQPGAPMVLLEIEDTGPGFNEDPQQLLRPFATTRRAKGGMGLGLAICQNLMKSHNGVIHLENRPDRGARVCLLFPKAVTEKESLHAGQKENSRCR